MPQMLVLACSTSHRFEGRCGGDQWTVSFHEKVSLHRKACYNIFVARNVVKISIPGVTMAQGKSSAELKD